MKIFKFMVVAILLPNCSALAIESGKAMSTQCLTSLHTTDTVLNHLSANSVDQSERLKEWAKLTAVSKESTSHQALSLLQKYEKMLNGGESAYPHHLREWRLSAGRILAELKESDFLIKNALAEVTAQITSEATLIKNSRPPKTSLVEIEPSAPDSNHKSESFLTLRLTALLEIKQGLDASLKSNYKLYLQLQTKFDLDHPFLRKDHSVLRYYVPENFPFQSVNLGATEGNREVWDLYNTKYTENSGGNRLAFYDTVSLAQKQKISILSREARLSNFLYPKSDWSNYQKALEKYLPIMAKTEDFVGQTIELAKFPSSSSPTTEFTIEAYDRSNNLVTLTHPSGLRTNEHASQLFKFQIQLNLLKDIQTLILNDKPALVFTILERHIVKPILVTQVSLTNLSFAGIEIGREEAEQRWISAKWIQGIPLSIDTTNIPWEGDGLKNRSLPLGTLLNAFSDNGKPQVLPLNVAGYGHVAPPEIQFTLDLKKPKQPKTWNTIANPSHENNDPTKKFFLQKMDELRVYLEPNGFYRDRAFAFIGASRVQALMFEKNIETLEAHLMNVKDYDNPGFFVSLTGDAKRKEQFKDALKELPKNLTEAQWYLQNHHDGKQEAIKLVQEILATLQRYNETIPKLQQAYQTNPEFNESLTLYFQERLVLLTQIVQKIGAEQKRLEQVRQKLESVFGNGLAVAEKYNLPIEPSNPYVIPNNIREDEYYGRANTYKSLSYGGQKTRDLLKIFFTSDVNSLVNQFSATPEDFPMTSKFGKQMSEWSSAKNSPAEYSFEISVRSDKGEDAFVKIEKPPGFYVTCSVRDSRTNEEAEDWPLSAVDRFLLQELSKTFAVEFATFMTQHKAVYSQTVDQLIVGYDEYLGRLLTINREGYIKETDLASFPLFWEALGPGVAVVAKNTVTKSYLGRGKSLTDSSTFISREHDINGKLKYVEKKYSEDIKEIEFPPKGTEIAGTSLVVGTSYLIIKPDLKYSLDRLIAEYKSRFDFSRNHFNSFINSFVDGAEPRFELDDATVTLQEKNDITHVREYNVSKEKLNKLIIVKTISTDDPVNKKLWSYLERRKAAFNAFTTLYMARLPDELLPGATLIYAKPVEGYHYNPPGYYLILDEDINRPDTGETL